MRFAGWSANCSLDGARCFVSAQMQPAFVFNVELDRETSTMHLPGRPGATWEMACDDDVDAVASGVFGIYGSGYSLDEATAEMPSDAVIAALSRAHACTISSGDGAEVPIDASGFAAAVSSARSPAPPPPASTRLPMTANSIQTLAERIGRWRRERSVNIDTGRTEAVMVVGEGPRTDRGDAVELIIECADGDPMVTIHSYGVRIGAAPILVIDDRRAPYTRNLAAGLVDDQYFVGDAEEARRLLRALLAGRRLDVPQGGTGFWFSLMGLQRALGSHRGLCGV